MRKWLIFTSKSFHIVTFSDGKWSHFGSDGRKCHTRENLCPAIIDVKKFEKGESSIELIEHLGKLKIFHLKILEIKDGLTVEMAKIALEMMECGNG